MEAINFARDFKIDVVLIDTAGRMQDNEPLMKALSKVWVFFGFFFLFVFIMTIPNPWTRLYNLELPLHIYSM